VRHVRTLLLLSLFFFYNFFDAVETFKQRGFNDVYVVLTKDVQFLYRSDREYI